MLDIVIDMTTAIPYWRAEEKDRQERLYELASAEIKCKRNPLILQFNQILIILSSFDVTFFSVMMEKYITMKKT